MVNDNTLNTGTVRHDDAEAARIYYADKSNDNLRKRLILTTYYGRIQNVPIDCF